MAWSSEHVRAFVERDWAAQERGPRALTPGQSHALAASLYEQARAADPSWPRPEDRDRDLAAHHRLVALFERIHRAQRRGVDAP